MIEFLLNTHVQRSGRELGFSDQRLCIYVFVLFWTSNLAQHSSNVHSVSSQREFRLLEGVKRIFFRKTSLESPIRVRKPWHPSDLCKSALRKHYAYIKAHRAKPITNIELTVSVSWDDRPLGPGTAYLNLFSLHKHAVLNVKMLRESNPGIGEDLCSKVSVDEPALLGQGQTSNPSRVE